MAGHAYTSTAEAVHALQARGFTESFRVTEQGLHAVNSQESFRAADATIVEHHRFEGVSDPDDLAVVYAIETRDGTRGVLVDAYGAYADPRVSAFLTQVSIRDAS